jgi:hypothetical protein
MGNEEPETEMGEEKGIGEMISDMRSGRGKSPRFCLPLLQRGIEGLLFALWKQQQLPRSHLLRFQQPNGWSRGAKNRASPLTAHRLTFLSIPPIPNAGWR